MFRDPRLSDTAATVLNRKPTVAALLPSKTIICSNGFSCEGVDLRQRTDLFNSFLQQTGPIMWPWLVVSFLSQLTEAQLESSCRWILMGGCVDSQLVLVFIPPHASATERKEVAEMGFFHPPFYLSTLRSARKLIWFPGSALVVFGAREDLDVGNDIGAFPPK